MEPQSDVGIQTGQSGRADRSRDGNRWSAVTRATEVLDLRGSSVTSGGQLRIVTSLVSQKVEMVTAGMYWTMTTGTDNTDASVSSVLLQSRHDISQITTRRHTRHLQ